MHAWSARCLLTTVQYNQLTPHGPWEEGKAGCILELFDPEEIPDLHISRVCGALVSLGIDPQAYAGHSFHIQNVGAATAAVRAGLEDSVIVSLGRWSSGAFPCYIQTPRDRLATDSRDLASVWSKSS